MVAQAFFMPSDLVTIDRAAVLAEKLTGEYFRLPDHEWRRNPYGIFTRKEVDEALYSENVFAHIVRMEPSASGRKADPSRATFGIVLQDPEILRALLRVNSIDLWTLALFILTHELTHIVRFRRSDGNLHAVGPERHKEELVVHAITTDILAGVTNTDGLIRLYDHPVDRSEPSAYTVRGRN
jgi:hypothetical protein